MRTQTRKTTNSTTQTKTIDSKDSSWAHGEPQTLMSVWIFQYDWGSSFGCMTVGIKRDFCRKWHAGCGWMVECGQPACPTLTLNAFHQSCVFLEAGEGPVFFFPSLNSSTCSLLCLARWALNRVWHTAFPDTFTAFIHVYFGFTKKSGNIERKKRARGAEVGAEPGTKRPRGHRTTSCSVFLTCYFTSWLFQIWHLFVDLNWRLKPWHDAVSQLFTVFVFPNHILKD